MKLARFIYNRKECWGILEGKDVKVLKESPFKSLKPLSRKIPLENIKILPPAEATKIILVGLNYKNHARELSMAIPKEPIIFLKPQTALVAHNGAVIYPDCVSQLDYEAELAVVIKKECKNIKPKDALKYILGYACLNDVTARDLQRKDIQWTRAKSFDTFCPFGPYLETKANPNDLSVRSYLNGKLKQNSRTSEFIFPLDYLISFISNIMTINPGDIISTGTPFGVGSMKRGDVIEVEIEGVARLRNYIK